MQDRASEGVVEIRVRRATADDARSIAAVEVASWRAGYRGLMPDAFLEQLSVEKKAEDWRVSLLPHEASARERVLVALADDAIIGFTSTGTEWEEGEVGLVYVLYVLPEYWGRGVGHALMSAAMGEIRDLGLREAMLWVFRDNLRARRFYERLGWHPDGRTRAKDYGGVELEALRYPSAVGG